MSILCFNHLFTLTHTSKHTKVLSYGQTDEDIHAERALAQTAFTNTSYKYVHPEFFSQTQKNNLF